MLRALFFDIDDTLISSTGFVDRARERAVDAMLQKGLRAEKAVVLEQLQQVVAEFGSNDDRHFNRLLKRLGPGAAGGVNEALLVTAGVIAYHETKWREFQMRPEDQAVLEFLAQTSLELGVISAGLTGKQMEKILRLELDRYIDTRLILITDQVGIAKSNPELYRRAAEAAGTSPDETMHVGDNATNDVDPAKRAGLKVTWLRGTGKYAALEPQQAPDHVIDDMAELRTILESDYGVGVH